MMITAEKRKSEKTAEDDLSSPPAVSKKRKKNKLRDSTSTAENLAPENGEHEGDISVDPKLSEQHAMEEEDTTMAEDLPQEEVNYSEEEDPAAKVVVKKQKRDKTLKWLKDGLALEDAIEALKRFVAEVEAFKTKESGAHDVVRDFLLAGCTGMEFIGALASGKKKHPSIFLCLEAIFDRMADDLSEYRERGMKVASVILSSHLDYVYTILRSSSASHAKGALRMLTAMVSLSHLTAREVIVAIDFSNPSIIKASEWQTPDHLPDVRSTYVTFITSFLLQEDTMLMRTMAENASILWPIFFHLRFDTFDVVQHFVTTLRDKLVMSNGLSKTLKFHIFSSSNLVQILRLFYWMGPKQVSKYGAKNAKPVPALDIPEDDKVAVAELLKDFLLVLTTSHKYGLAFPDYDLGVRSQTKNRIIMELLKSMYDFWSGTNTRIVGVQAELVVKTIEKCPDLVDCYIRWATPDLNEVRTSFAYKTLLDTIREAIAVQNLSVLFNPKEKYSVNQQSQRAATILGCLALPHNFFHRGLTHPETEIRIAFASFLQVLFKKINELEHILNHNPKADAYSKTEKEQIFLKLKGKVVKAMPPSPKLIQICLEMPQLKGQKFYIEGWLTLLDILASYAKLGWFDAQTTRFPIYDILVAVTDCENEPNVTPETIDKLKQSLFTLILSLTPIPELGVMRRKHLITELGKCVAGSASSELRQCVHSLLFKIAHQYLAANHLSTEEMYTWTSALEHHPKAVNFFAENFCLLLSSLPATLEQDLKMFLGLTESKESQPEEKIALPCSPLLIAAVKCLNQLEKEEKEALSYLSAVARELLLIQKGDTAKFAESFMKNGPEKLLSDPALKRFFLSWSKNQMPEVTSTKGMNPPAGFLYNCCFSKFSDWESLKKSWEQEIISKRSRPDQLETALCQAITCTFAAESRGANRTYIIDLVSVILDGEASDSGYPLRSKLLKDSRVLNWFDVSNVTDKSAQKMNILIKNSLKLIRNKDLERAYQLNLNSTITRCLRRQQPLVDMDEEELFLLLNKLNINEVKVPIKSLVKQASIEFSEVSLRYLNVYLRVAAHLRLEGIASRLPLPTYVKVLQFFATRKAPPALKKGLYDLTSLCLEFLDAQEFPSVLNACVESTEDWADFCTLLITSSSHLQSTFGQWCLQHEEHFKDINWRLQVVSAYLSACQDETIVHMLHRNLTPALKSHLMNRDDYLAAVARFPALPDLLRILVPKCWSKKECRQLLTEQMTQSKKGLQCAQFVEVGRRSRKYSEHASLCMSLIVRHLKAEEVDTAEIVLLSKEFDWLSNEKKVDKPALVKSMIEDKAWDKLVKYTLRIGLRALDGEESVLPPIALRVMTSVWLILRAGDADDITPLSQKIYEMITGHSEFLTIIMDEHNEYVDQKKAILELLTSLIQVNPKLCQNGQVPMLLSSYGATRSTNDQLILRLLRMYESNGVVLSTYRPYLWGQNAAAHYAMRRTAATPSRAQLPDGTEVLTLLNGQKMLKTAYEFPLELKLNGDEIVEESDHYDPRFMLASLAHILSPEYSIHCSRFIHSGATSLLFASISSSCGEMRSLGWFCLSRLREQLFKATKWLEGALWVNMIDCLRFGVVESSAENATRVPKHPKRVANVVALFLAKAAAIMRDPLHQMYRAVNNFLLVRPVLDVSNVPEFFVLLHSTELPEQRAFSRAFLFNLLRDGIKSQLDYLACARRKIFRLLLTLQPSNLLTDGSEKQMILEVVQSTLRQPALAYDLIMNRGLIMWLDSLIIDKSASGDLDQLLAVVETMWETLYNHMQTKRKLSENDKDDIENFEKQIVLLEEKETDAKDNAHEKKENADEKKSSGIQKSIWNLLPNHQQIVSPVILNDFMQLMINLWRALYEVEPNYSNFEKYIRVLCSAASHLYESKKLIEGVQKTHPKTVQYFSPPAMLGASFLRQLVDVSSRFVNDLPDLSDHLEYTSNKKRLGSSDPSELCRTWERRYEYMRKLTGQAEHAVAIRTNLHMLISLAHCGV